MNVICKLFFLVGVTAAAVLALSATSAGAQGTGPSYDFCVRCTAPSATYVCTVGPGRPDPGERVWSGFCGEKVRQSGAHRSCRATALTDACKPSRVYVYKGLVADRRQADNLLSQEPERRSRAASGIMSQAVENLRRTGREIDKGARAVGRTVGRTVVEGVDAAGEGAQTVGGAIVEGTRSLGRNVEEGVDCVISLGRRC